MDSHFEQVMKARDAVSGTGTRTYFAFSTILDRAAFEEWRTQHAYEFFDLPKGELGEAQDMALVYDFPSRWWGGRVAGLKDEPGTGVFGLLFQIAEKDWPIVQHKEGFVTHMSVERTVKVRVGGKQVEATAFVTNPARASMDGPISERFVSALVRGARSASLPEAYVKGLEETVTQ